MVRQTKAPKFTIYEDAGIPPTPDSIVAPPFDEALLAQEHRLDAEHHLDNNDEDGEQDLSTEDERERQRALDECVELIEAGFSSVDRDIAATFDDAGRMSAITSTSVSSFPLSNFDLDDDETLPPMHHPYTPPMVRPAFRRPSSVRRMQMTSPTPFERSPRRSVLHQSRSRPGTPRSVRESVRGSPKPRRAVPEDDDETRAYPLVLLHVTLLPVELRWSTEVMHDLLPQETLDNLELLRSKVSDNVAQRGILIQHPKAEYELLEERLLQALELSRERVTKCGHFRARDSISSLISSQSSVRDSDSGVGSDVDACSTCNQSVKLSKLGACGDRVWSVRVFAANGLLGPSAWAAAWADMERVDVEILPWIDVNLRKALDARQEEEDAVYAQRQAEDDARVRAMLMEQATLTHGQSLQIEDQELLDQTECPEPDVTAIPRPSSSREHQPTTRVKGRRSSLPQVYRVKEIPLSILLRNYVFLLAQDSKNVAIFVLAVIVLWLGVRSSAAATSSSQMAVIAGPYKVPLAKELPESLPAVVKTNATVELPSLESSQVAEPEVGAERIDAVPEETEAKQIVEQQA